ncbi:S41 family peptidase [Endomicrobium proavitum]|uniref:Carboxy-terminal-processing protease n=1 Tax=Endomicrobium proavitum TaxID=1408281 RepID=A0A0G3WGR6_9BACT|nr:S41 family peptidase [Endomicrobium proavitum]AKL97513.1 Carboxy-terminal-processing protease [Endomicrobium proavitum]
MKIVRVKILSAVLIISLFCAGSVFAADETYEKLKTMIDVMEIINVNYVSETKSADLAVGAIKGVVRTLDPFSQYMEEKAYKDMKNETEGNYSGVGLRIMEKNGFITVVSPIVGTPAFKAGVLPDDRIIKIDKKSAQGMSTNEAVDLMRGKAGKKVKVIIRRDNVVEDLVFDLVREKIKIETVRSTMLEENIAYIRLSEFNAQSAADVKKELSSLKKEGAQAVILDLRNNPGGLLDSAIDIISAFVKEKTLALTTRGRVEGSEKKYYTHGVAEFADIPFIILVNRGSASASEIVSGAFQDFKRALIIGQNTFGKGSVQTIFPLSDGTALRLTIAKYYLPSGRPINRSDDVNAKNGITPDIEIKVSIEDEIKLYTQADMVFAKDSEKKSDVKTDDKNKVEDEALKKAIEIIKAGNVAAEIEKSAKQNSKK